MVRYPHLSKEEKKQQYGHKQYLNFTEDGNKG